MKALDTTVKARSPGRTCPSRSFKPTTHLVRVDAVTIVERICTS